MKRITLTAHDEISEALRSAASRPLETAGVLLVGVSETPDELRLLAREYHPVPLGAATWSIRKCKHSSSNGSHTTVGGKFCADEAYAVADNASRSV